MINCGPSKGEFGWAVSHDKDKDILERELYQVTDFKMTRLNLIFAPEDTIHYIYTFDRNPGLTTEFVVTLEEETLGFIEIDLKKKKIEPETTSLKDKFVQLKPGRYRLRIVFEQEVIDGIEFEVLSEDGYKIELKEDGKEEADDIIRNSR